MPSEAGAYVTHMCNAFLQRRHSQINTVLAEVALNTRLCVSGATQG